MSMPERNGDWMLRTSAEDDAPQRTASRKALSWSGGSNPVGSGRATFSMSRAPGSNSQTTWISSPSPSSSTDASETSVWGSDIPCSPLVGSVLGTTSLTIQFRDRTLTSCPCSGALTSAIAIPWFPVESGLGCTRSCLCWLSTLFSLREKNRPIKHVARAALAIRRTGPVPADLHGSLPEGAGGEDRRVVHPRL